MNKEKIINWLNELADMKPESYGEYFYDDLRNFVVDKESKSKKIDALFKCENKKEVKDWMDNACSFIIMKLDIDLLLEDYFYSE